MLVDTHCHLDFPEFDQDRDQVIQRANSAGVGCIINIGSGIEASRKAQALAGKYPCLYATLGVHPHDADGFNDKLKAQIRELTRADKLVAIGETGLDYYRNYSAKEKQQALFAYLVSLAKDLNLPLVIHSRQAEEDTLKILRQYLPLRAVVHCFSSGEDFLKQCLELGLMISFTCNITYKKADSLRRLAGLVPLSRLMLETDAPFLPPEGLRGKRNEPMQVKALAEEIGRIKGADFEEVSRVTTENARNFFAIEAK